MDRSPFRTPHTSRSEGAHCEREIEVEFRGLKQTLDKGILSCRSAERVVVELDWSLFSQAYAELLSLREQIPQQSDEPIRVSLAETMRAIRRAMRERNESVASDELLDQVLRTAVIASYNNRTDKKARYRPHNPDKKPLGDPKVRAPDLEEQQKLNENRLANAA
ncbi:hypothetical protein LF1_29100 [Rubripirellula obstinata]|uniref:Uncharacterized protein n=1 Tax=Rubripirellula obstinata TaxID=406547 RepID=A0A5B1CLF5_9BACT|nr:hypothetical protein [Rubripirellula obstinata]KAA1260370.1 hypothetical protein LF1_29100 [Rubripirellula obstinata]